MTITVKPGQTVALVGNSGSGKSTVIQLLQRFYSYNRGCISIGNTPIEKFNLEYIRSQIGVVNQEPILFNTSVRENIRMGNAKVSDEEILQALEQANALDFVQRLPSGLDTLCGQQGSQMSGGQKQRIAIARVLVRSPQIILLDEVCFKFLNFVKNNLTPTLSAWPLRGHWTLKSIL